MPSSTCSPSSSAAMPARPTTDTDLLGQIPPHVHGQAESPAQLRAVSRTPSQRRASGWTVQVKTQPLLLFGTWKELCLLRRKSQADSERKATHTERIHQWSQRSFYRFSIKGNILPFQKFVRMHHCYRLHSTWDQTQHFVRNPPEKLIRCWNILKKQAISISITTSVLQSPLLLARTRLRPLMYFLVIHKVAARYLFFIMLFWEQLRCKPASNPAHHWPKVKPHFMSYQWCCLLLQQYNLVPICISSADQREGSLLTTLPLLFLGSVLEHHWFQQVYLHPWFSLLELIATSLTHSNLPPFFSGRCDFKICIFWPHSNCLWPPVKQHKPKSKQPMLSL